MLKASLLLLKTKPLAWSASLAMTRPVTVSRLLLAALRSEPASLITGAALTATGARVMVTMTVTVSVAP